MLPMQVDEVDYDARMAAYGRLTPEAWRGFAGVALPPLIHQCAHDLRNPDDLGGLGLGFV